MRSITVVFALSLLFLCATAGAQGPSTLNVSGAGARAAAMGGAFTAIADDATAAFYNPAGLCQLKRMEVTGVGYYSLRVNDPKIEDANATYPKVTSSRYNFNFGSIVFPLNPEGKNFVIGAAVHEMMGFKMNVNSHQRISGAYGDGIIKAARTVDGGIYSVAGLVAYELSNSLSLGAGMRFFTGKPKLIDESLTVYESYPEGGNTVYRYWEFGMKARGGPQFNFGLLYKYGSRIRAGAMVAAQGGKVLMQEAGTLVIVDDTIDKNQSQGMMSPMETGLPAIYNLGLALRVRDEFTLSCDYHTYLWGDTRSKRQMALEDDLAGDSSQVHLGAEYLLETGREYPVPLRLGFYTLPLGSYNSFNQMMLGHFAADNQGYMTEDDFVQQTRKFVTAGAGFITTDAVADIAVEYSPLSESYNINGVSYSNKETVLQVYLSFIYKFKLGES